MRNQAGTTVASAPNGRYGLARTLAKSVGAAFLALSAVGCEEMLNQTASLGGSVAGQRGTVRVLYINNTPYRAVFTAGTFDQYDQDSTPDIHQFALDDFFTVLDGETESSIRSLRCGRAFAIGTPQLLDFIGTNLRNADVVDEALVQGVQFHEIADEDDVDAIPRGAAPPFAALLGVDFPCGALLIIRFEVDDVGPDPFRVDFELIPSESTR